MPLPFQCRQKLPSLCVSFLELPLPVSARMARVRFVGKGTGLIAAQGNGDFLVIADFLQALGGIEGTSFGRE